MTCMWVCSSCGEVELPKDNLGMSIFYLAVDWGREGPATYFICKCGKKAYAKEATMEVTFQIEAEQLSDDIRELLGKLSDEKKEELAVQILTEALKSGETTLARYIGIDKALEDINQGREKDRYRFNSKKNWLENENGHHWVPDQVRSRFNSLVNQYAHFYGYFQEQILDKMLAVAVERVEKLVRESPKIQQTIDDAVQEIERRFPDIVQAAMQRLFLNTLENAIRGQQELSTDQEAQGEMLKQIQDRLGQLQTQL